VPLARSNAGEGGRAALGNSRERIPAGDERKAKLFARGCGFLPRPLLAARGLAALVILCASGSASAADKKAPEDSGSALTTRASTEVSGYSDTDHVLVASPSVAASVSNPLAGWSISGHYLVDVVSAASVDIVSTASNKWVEMRQAGSAEGTLKIGSATVSGSGVFSSEPDYLSLAGGGMLTIDLFEKNVTPFLGISYGQDQVGRTGLERQFWRSKETIGGQLGVTFVVNRSTISSLQLDAIQETGYLAKPYRYVPLFAPGQGAAIQPGASIDEVNAKRLDVRPAEQVPGSRHRFAATWRLARRFEGATLRLEERAYADTWGLDASTTDVRYLFAAGDRLTLWPHLRFHAQNHVIFWQVAYEAVPGPNGAWGVPAIRTGDREISSLYTATLGAGVRWKLADDFRTSWALVLEGDFAYTRYLEALYITDRRAVFSTLAFEGEF
jgi:hypothetical protein